jgi:hypothetical protein
MLIIALLNRILMHQLLDILLALLIHLLHFPFVEVDEQVTIQPEVRHHQVSVEHFGVEQLGILKVI